MDPLSFDVSTTVELIKCELKGKDAAIAQCTEVDAEKVRSAPGRGFCFNREERADRYRGVGYSHRCGHTGTVCRLLCESLLSLSASISPIWICARCLPW